MKLYLATNNAHKIEELGAMFASEDIDVEVHTPQAVGGMPDVVEDQDSFTGNALKKARALAALLPEGSFALADDSGLSVEALDGEPGVYSARYAGEDASDQDNINKLLQELDTIEEINRSAYFSCCLALVAPHGAEHTFEGRCEGRIDREERGDSGFGYDPVFVPEGYTSSFAEISESEKAAISHRGAALRKLVDWIKSGNL